MTIKVVAKGSLKCTCHNCKSILEYEYDDIYMAKLNMDYLGDYDLKEVIRCPVCNKEIPV